MYARIIYGCFFCGICNIFLKIFSKSIVLLSKGMSVVIEFLYYNKLLSEWLSVLMFDGFLLEFYFILLNMIFSYYIFVINIIY